MNNNLVIVIILLILIILFITSSSKKYSHLDKITDMYNITSEKEVISRGVSGVSGVSGIYAPI